MGNVKKTILLVDDDPVHLLITRSMLVVDYDVDIARSGQEAVEYFEMGRLPDLVLLDLHMPGLDGIATFMKLKALSVGKEVPVIFLTAVDDDVEKEKAMGMGAVDYFTKPLYRQDLLSKVGKIFSKRQDSEVVQ